VNWKLRTKPKQLLDYHATRATSFLHTKKLHCACDLAFDASHSFRKFLVLKSHWPCRARWWRRGWWARTRAWRRSSRWWCWGRGRTWRRVSQSCRRDHTCGRCTWWFCRKYELIWFLRGAGAVFRTNHSLCNLRIGPISKSVCTCQISPAESVCAQAPEPTLEWSTWRLQPTVTVKLLTYCFITLNISLKLRQQRTVQNNTQHCDTYILSAAVFIVILSIVVSTRPVLAELT